MGKQTMKYEKYEKKLNPHACRQVPSSQVPSCRSSCNLPWHCHIHTGTQWHNSFVSTACRHYYQLATSQRAGVIWSAGRSASLATTATMSLLLLLLLPRVKTMMMYTVISQCVIFDYRSCWCENGWKCPRTRCWNIQQKPRRYVQMTDDPAMISYCCDNDYNLRVLLIMWYFIKRWVVFSCMWQSHCGLKWQVWYSGLVECR